MIINQIINELNQNLKKVLPGRINKIILYGSHARNEASADSDIDILAICSGVIDSTIREQIYNECYLINSKYDVWIDISLLAESDLKTIKGKQPYVQNALYEGISL
ncbi:MAG: nucleotidyltransferase domain-containing protein [Bacteroidota bacterium]